MPSDFVLRVEGRAAHASPWFDKLTTRVAVPRRKRHHRAELVEAPPPALSVPSAVPEGHHLHGEERDQAGAQHDGLADTIAVALHDEGKAAADRAASSR